MTRRSVHTLTASLILTLFSVAFTSAQTIGTFDGGGDTPITLETFGDAPGPSVMGPGLDGNFLLLTGPVNAQNNFATFDRSDAGTFATSDFRFDFLIAPDQTLSADGISFSYANTATYGTSGGIGAAAFTPEDPAAAGVLGFGFDTWSNQGAFDNPDVDTGSDYSEISLFYDGNLILRVDDTRLLDPSLTLDDGIAATGEGLHVATGSVDFAGGTASLQVDGNPIFTDVAVPGLVPFESRIMFAARTGGENEFAGIDNIEVNFTPEPATGLLALIGFALVLCRRRAR